MGVFSLGGGEYTQQLQAWSIIPVINPPLSLIFPVCNAHQPEMSRKSKSSSLVYQLQLLTTEAGEASGGWEWGGGDACGVTEACAWHVYSRMTPNPTVCVCTEGI